MKYLKYKKTFESSRIFEEIKIDQREFPNDGHSLSPREKDYIKRFGADLSSFDYFGITKDDGYYYTIIRHLGHRWYNRFENIKELSDYIYLRACIERYEFVDTERIEDIISDTELDLSFDENSFIKWIVSSEYYVSTFKIFNVPNIDKTVENNKLIRMLCYLHKVEDIKTLLKDPKVDPSASNNVSIRNACHDGDLEIVKLLLSDPRVDPSASNNASIRNACKNGHLEIVKLLLKDPRVDPSAYSNEAIRNACKNGNLEIVKLLLKDPRVDPSDTADIASRLACSNNHIDVVKILLEHPKVNPNNLILSAVEKGSVEMVKLLLSKENIDPSYNNNLALKQAVRYDYSDILILLLRDRRIDPTNMGKHFPPSHILWSAMDWGSKDCLKRLIRDPRLNKTINSSELSVLINYINK